MREGNKLVGLSSRRAWRRQKKARLRQRLPEHGILKGDRSTTAFSLRHHSVYVAHTNPILVKRDSPLGVIVSLGPRPMNAQGAEAVRGTHKPGSSGGVFHIQAGGKLLAGNHGGTFFGDRCVNDVCVALSEWSPTERFTVTLHVPPAPTTTAAMKWEPS